MKLSRRQKEMFDFILYSNNIVTAKELADKFSVSKKTIYRDMKNIGQSLMPFDNVITKEYGKGYKINYREYVKYKENNNKIKQSKNNISVGQRRLDILLYMLSISPNKISIDKLANKYLVSPASIVNDFKYIETKYLLNTNLKLNKNNLGTSIFGNEFEIRKLSAHLYFQDAIGTDDLINSVYVESKRIAVDIIRLFDKAQEKYNIYLDNPYYINVLTHLLILSYRVINEKYVKNEKNNLETINFDKEEIRYCMAKYIIFKLEKYLSIPIPQSEVKYLYKYLISSRSNLDKNADISKNFDNKVEDNICIKFTKELIKKVSKYLNHDLTTDVRLYHTLLLHVKSMLLRVNYNIVIENILLKQIKKEFFDLYNIVTKAVFEVSKNLIWVNITHDEIGYLVLYFQESIERINDKNKKIIIVCSTGIGSSRLLKCRVTKFFPKWQIVDVISSRELYRKKNLDNIDLILSTINIDECNVPYILVNAFLNQNDINNIMKFFN